jgi:hypothetical protein
MLREAKRQNKSYQRHAFEVLGQYSKARTDLDLASTVLDIVSPVVDDLVASEDKMDVDGGEEKVGSNARDDILAFAITSSGQSFGTLTWQNKNIASEIEGFLNLLVKANNIQSRQIALATMTALGTVFNAVDDGIAAQLQKKQDKVVGSLRNLLFKPLYPSYGYDFKLQRAKVVFVVAGLPQGKEVLQERLDGEISSEPSDPVREELKQARSRLI